MQCSVWWQQGRWQPVLERMWEEASSVSKISYDCLSDVLHRRCWKCVYRKTIQRAKDLRASFRAEFSEYPCRVGGMVLSSQQHTYVPNVFCTELKKLWTEKENNKFILIQSLWQLSDSPSAARIFHIFLSVTPVCLKWLHVTDIDWQRHILFGSCENCRGFLLVFYYSSVGSGEATKTALIQKQRFNERHLMDW